MKLLRESLASRIQTMRQFPTYTNQPPSTLYHNTKLANVESILANGILLAKARFPEYEGKGIWATANEPGKVYGGRTVAFNSEGYDLENVGGRGLPGMAGHKTRRHTIRGLLRDIE